MEYSKRKSVQGQDRIPLFKSSRYRAILCADIHLSHKPPVCRSGEPDWYATMGGYLNQLRELQEKHNIPILMAGDLFDKWSSPPELINFALEYLPQMYAIPGQHDLPMHYYEDIKKSAFWTLAKVGKIQLVEHHKRTVIPVHDLNVDGFPWGFDVQPLEAHSTFCLEIALVHQYVWTKDTGYQGAPEANRLKHFRQKAKGYDVVVIGDNHCPWTFTKDGITFVNCGSLFRRTIDQYDYKPAVWLLDDKGRVTPHYLDVSKDKFLDEDRLKEVKVGGKKIGDFLASLKDLKDVTLSFEEAVTRVLQKEKVSPEVKSIVLSAMEGL